MSLKDLSTTPSPGYLISPRTQLSVAFYVWTTRVARCAACSRSFNYSPLCVLHATELDELLRRYDEFMKEVRDVR